MISSFDSKKTFYQLNTKKDIPIIFIHGVGLNHSMWEPQVNAFDNTVLTYDILGHGKTSLEKNNITFDDFSEQLLNLVKELNIEKFHLNVAVANFYEVTHLINDSISKNISTKYLRETQIKIMRIMISI